MEYAGSYALFNYRLENPKFGLKYDNLRLIRAFEHGLDPKSSEAGFVLVHVDSECCSHQEVHADRLVVQNSGPLVDGVVSALDACEANDREAFDVGLNKVVESMTKVNKVMEG
jgi:indoleamine 2,3-dioxygenase